ncbi:alpha-L-rhamnosidase [Tengunoibacter tsumagoiensis]|uniref:alpha-L-rhamnosidase n=1 Tax=Tengunoibacter tsumagoiensis TaxID=2014871 RepID=A0A402A458_9CHLR|nr:alpha-L-rhamnosidase [Tengunoibacter tsumagoiensis]GCE13775.1 alfa-L-rhamnosidase [Tengunoibacter tsumagoiensis]
MSQIQIVHLRCEYAQNPLGIDVEQPRFSWQLATSQPGRRGVRQTAYRILAGPSQQQVESGEDLLWDSGKVPSDQSIQIVYAGPALRSRQRVYWTVQIWDEEDQRVTTNELAYWEMGLLHASDWSAEWIGSEVFRPVQTKPMEWLNLTPEQMIQHWQDLSQQALASITPSTYLYKAVELHQQVVRARVYSTARGIYQLAINGQRVGADLFRPGWTDYNQRLQYQTYDITPLLQVGGNGFGLILADGWFAGVLSGGGQRHNYGMSTQALLQIELTYQDGSQQRIISDASWKISHGPVRYADLYLGEFYDARLEWDDWATAALDVSSWSEVVAEPVDAALLSAQIGPTVQRVLELEPISVQQPEAGVFIFDLGQNMVGWVRLRMQGGEGTRVRIRYSEMLNPDGTLYTTNLRTACSTDTYIFKGTGTEEVYEPTFTFHGFRYVELTEMDCTPVLSSLTGIVVQSATPGAGHFECSSPLVNQLVQNIQWGQRGNFLDVPTDCPQRDERLGWAGDAQIFARTATYNADVAGFFTKWLRDIADAQFPSGGIPNIVPALTETSVGAPGWVDVAIILPWTLSRVYGDLRLLEQYYPMMTRAIEFLTINNPQHLWRAQRNGGGNGAWDFGDWLSIDAQTSKDVLADAFYAYSVSLLASIAETLGKDEDAQKYQELFQQIKAAFNAAHVSADGHITGDTQTAYVLALSFHLLPEELRPAATHYLVDDIQRKGGHLSTGFLGVGHLLPALTEHGRLDIAYQLLLQESFPSWGYSIRQGATTIWERWDGWTEEKGFQDASMNSFNHYSLGSVGDWLFRYVAGIETDSGQHGERSGYKHILFQPHIHPALSFVKASYDSIHGRITSAWDLNDAGFIHWRGTVPPNTTATLLLPVCEGASVLESGDPIEEVAGITLLKREGELHVYHLESGDYHLSVKQPS